MTDDEPQVARITYEEDQSEEKATVFLDTGTRPVIPRVPCLVAVGGTHSLGRIFRFRDQATIGRAVSCDLVLAESGVSRRHAKVHVTADKVVHIQDFGSANGILTEGRKLTGPSTMQIGQRFEIGDAAIALLWMDDIPTIDANQIHDPQTRLLTRRHFGEVLARELRFAARYKVPLTLMLFSLDNYRSVSDQYGERAAVYCLRRLAMGATTFLAREDLSCARFGEDQFILLLPETSRAAALETADLIRKGAESSKLEHEGDCVGSTLSVGVTVLESSSSNAAPNNNPEEAIDRVERQLYRAKVDGRNRVVCE